MAFSGLALKASRLLVKLSRPPAPPVTRVFKTSAVRCSEDIDNRRDILNSSFPPIGGEIRSPPCRFYAHLKEPGSTNELVISIEEVVIKGEFEEYAIAGPENLSSPPTTTSIPIRLLNMMSPLRWLRSTPENPSSPGTRSLITLLNVVSPLCGLRSTPIRAREAKETGEGLRLRLDMPGIRLEDVKVSVDQEQDTRLIIEAEARSILKEGVGGYTSMVVLPRNIYDTSNIKRDMALGVLTLSVPKKQDGLKKGVEFCKSNRKSC